LAAIPIKSSSSNAGAAEPLARLRLCGALRDRGPVQLKLKACLQQMNSTELDFVRSESEYTTVQFSSSAVNKPLLAVILKDS